MCPRITGLQVRALPGANQVSELIDRRFETLKNRCNCRGHCRYFALIIRFTAAILISVRASIGILDAVIMALRSKEQALAWAEMVLVNLGLLRERRRAWPELFSRLKESRS